MMRLAPAARSDEMASLAERIGSLHVVRIVSLIAAIVTPLVSVLPNHTSRDLYLGCATYAATIVSLEVLRKLHPGRSFTPITVALLVDGLFLRWVMYATGGASSPMNFMVYVHVISVILLASYRTGLKVSVWHSLLAYASFYGQRADLIPTVQPAHSASALLLFTGALWLIATSTAACSAINERALRRRRADLEALTEMARRIRETDEPREIATILLTVASEAFGLARGAVLTTTNGRARVLAEFGCTRLESGESGELLARAWETHAPVLAARSDGDELLSELLPQATNIVVIPIFRGQAPYGAVVVEHDSGRIERSTLAVVEQFARHGGLAIQNAELLQEVRRLAEVDPLTGVANRRSMQAVLERESDRCKRSDAEMAMVLLDVDHFKSYNDEFGHQAGDELLTAIATSLASTCRTYDTVARYGGEEFAVVLPDCSEEEAGALADRLRAGVSALRGMREVTASAGVAVFPCHGRNVDEVIKAADDALYESKRSGRNRTTIARTRDLLAAEAAQ